MEIAWDGCLAFVVYLDFGTSTIPCGCSTSTPNSGNPRRGEYKIPLDDAGQPYLFGETTQPV